MSLTPRQIAARELRALRAEHPGLHHLPASTSKVWAATRLRVRLGSALAARSKSKCISQYVAVLTAASELLWASVKAEA